MEPIAATWMIIADGSADVAAARQKLAELERHVFPVSLTTGYPAVVDSTNVPGLKPGFSVVVVGACANKADAEARLDLVRAVSPGAYLRPVTAREACPTIAPTTPVTSAGPKVKSWPVGGGSKAHFELHRPTSSPQCPGQSLVLEARLESDQLLSTLALTGECTPAGEFAPGRMTAWKDPLPVTVDGQTYFALRMVDRTGGTESATDFLYGFACGQWRPLVGPVVGGAGPEAVVNKFDGPTPGQLRLRRWTGNPSDAELAGAPNETLTYTLDPKTCAAVEPAATLESIQ